MSFNEKLQSLRKEKKLSQEQLADMLDVTRQSVSKWESGTTYPEMDKLIMLTKIFNCSLDDLTNDEVSEISVEKKASSPFGLNTLLDRFLGFIEKTVKMFKSMKAKDIWICLFVMFDISIILLVFNIPLMILKDHFAEMMMDFGSLRFANVASGIFDFILTVVFFALYIIVLVYIFKVAYLDRYEFVKTEKHEEIVEEKEPIKEVKIVTNVPSSKDNPLFKVLGGIALGFVKFLAVCFIVPVLFVLVGVCFLLAIDVYLITQGITFIGILLLLLFTILGCALLIETVSTFIFNKKFPYKRLLWTFIITLVGLGISFGVSLLELGRFDYIDDIPKNSNIKQVSKDTTYAMQEDLQLAPYCHYCDIKYVENDSLGSNIQVNISYYKDFLLADLRLDGSTIVVERNDLGEFTIMKNIWKEAKEDLKNDLLYDYDQFYIIDVTVSGSKANIDKIKENTQKKMDEIREKERQNEHNALVEEYESEIRGYINEIDDYNRQIEDLQEKNQNLQDKVQELEDYKERVNEILGE